jgi:hypothetical protein
MTILVMLCLITARLGDGGSNVRGDGSGGGAGGDSVGRGGGTVRRKKCFGAQRRGGVRVSRGGVFVSG